MTKIARFSPCSDLPEWTVWDNERKCDLFPTRSGNRSYNCRRCDEATVQLIADALNAYTARPSTLSASAPAMFEALSETLKYWEVCKVKVPAGLKSQLCAALAQAQGEG